VIVTVYVPEQSIVMQRAVAPVFHRYELIPNGAHNVVVSPSSGLRLPVMLHNGASPTVTVLLQTLLHPLELVTVTEYVPAVPTVTHFVVAPVFHR